jgi:long-chain acyl-CoA synthetase
MNIPVIPVSIKGAIEAMPKGSKFPKPRKRIKIKFHKPVYPGNHTYQSLSDEVYNSIQHDLVPQKG